jgi:hypothetical protein
MNEEPGKTKTRGKHRGATVPTDAKVCASARREGGSRRGEEDGGVSGAGGMAEKDCKEACVSGLEERGRSAVVSFEGRREVSGPPPLPVPIVTFNI